METKKCELGEKTKKKKEKKILKSFQKQLWHYVVKKKRKK